MFNDGFQMMVRVFIVAAVSALVACSSSVGTDQGVDRPVTAAALADSLARENISARDTLPQNGSAHYAGFMTLALPMSDASTDYIGDLDMTVNFGATNNQISGSARNFTGLSGSLVIADGNIARGTDTDVDYTFDGVVTGALGLGGESYTLNGALVGDFRGRYQDGLTGQVFGTVDGACGQDLFQGSIAATRDN